MQSASTVSVVDASATAARTAAPTPAHQSAGACSAQPASLNVVSWLFTPEPTSLPRSSHNAARVDSVPTSTETTNRVCAVGIEHHSAHSDTEESPVESRLRRDAVGAIRRG
eukprot:scaffold193233_cov28-Tisochrysis_lutea.AAC.4